MSGLIRSIRLLLLAACLGLLAVLLLSTPASRNQLARFEPALKRRKKVTANNKINIMKVADWFYVERTRNVAKEFLEVELEDVLIDVVTAYWCEIRCAST